MINLRPIEESEFESTDPVLRAIVHDHARKFASLQVPGASHSLVLSWRSDLIDPVLAPHPAWPAIWVGVDQRVVALTPQGSISFSLGLSSALSDIKHFPRCTVVVCDDEAIVVNKDHSLRAIVRLRDVPDTVEMRDDRLIVTFADGATDSLPV